MKSLIEIVFRDRLSKLKVFLAMRTYTGFCVVPLALFKCVIRTELREREVFCHPRTIAMLRSPANMTDTKDKIVSYYLVLRQDVTSSVLLGIRIDSQLHDYKSFLYYTAQFFILKSLFWRDILKL